jgi:hypothetical protein
LTTAPRERLVNRRLARTLADRPRPKVLARGLLRRPRLETRPLLGGSERLGMNGCAHCARLEWMRPGRTRKSSSRVMAAHRTHRENSSKANESAVYAGCA